MKYYIYDGLVEQCKQRKITPTAALVACGVDRTAVTRWSRGQGATEMAAQKVADYFGITVEELTGKKEKPTPKESELDALDAEIMKLLQTKTVEQKAALLQFLRSNP